VEEDVPRPIPDAAQDLAAIWRRAQEELRASVSESTYQLWFEQLRPVSSRGPILFLTGPRHVLRWVGKRYPELIRAALSKSESGLREFDLVTPDDPVARSTPADSAATARVALNPAYTFERFVIGPGNRVAHGAALAVAESPGQAYNPLFLQGPPGLGKTHLLGAIANYLHIHSPELAVHYTTAESFTNEFVSSLQGAGIDAFKERYRRADVLLIDDVQFLEGKARTADEFFHTFNALYEHGAQLVLTADRVPAELSALAERLRDRFEWGLTVSVSPPDLATRLLFLGNLAREQPEQLPPDALRAIAAKTSANLRVLKGALTRVVALSSLTASDLSADAVRRALPSEEIVEPSTGLEARQIQEAVAAKFGLTVDAILSPNRTAAIARARQIAMYLTRDLTDLSLPAIATAFNRRDHTTVMHAIRKVERRTTEDAALSRILEQLTAELRSPEMDRDRTD
jgi:chromosomal replication initiator protein